MIGTETDLSRKSPVWFSSYGKSVQLFLVLFKPYIDLKVKLSLKPSACEVITVQPCFHINTSEMRIKKYNISFKSIHFAEEMIYITADPRADNYYNYYYEKACHLHNNGLSETINKRIRLRHKYAHCMYYIYQIYLQKASCLTVQVLPDPFTFKAYTVDDRGRRIQTVCDHYFIVSNADEMTFRGYYLNNFLRRDGSETNILSKSGAMLKSNVSNERIISFDISGELALLNFNLDMDYSASPLALVAQYTEQIASENFKFQLATIKEHSHQLIVLLSPILSVNIPKITNDINQCKKIDIKVLPSAHANNETETETCADAFVMLTFYRGGHTVTSTSTKPKTLHCIFLDFACKDHAHDALMVWYKIKCNEPSPLSLVVDSKVSYKAEDRNIIFPRNMEFEILHSLDYKDLYVKSPGYIGLKINNTTKCFNPIINFAGTDKINNITFEGRQYFLFNGDDDGVDDSLDSLGLFYLDYWHGQISWNRAAQYCESRGLHLLTIGDAEEERDVLSLLSQKSPGRSHIVVSVFLGLISQRQVIFNFWIITPFLR